MMRAPSDHERTLIETLLRAAHDDVLLTQLADLRVTEMADGGMGSLRIFADANLEERRALGGQIAAAEFIDSDGVLVSVALNVDTNGRLFELDVWKVDFTPLRRWPEPAAIRIV